MVCKPSDLGCDDNGYILPPLRSLITIYSNIKAQDTLFAMPGVFTPERRAAVVVALTERVQAAARSERLTMNSSLFWCDLNSEVKHSPKQSAAREAPAPIPGAQN